MPTVDPNHLVAAIVTCLDAGLIIDSTSAEVVDASLAVYRGQDGEYVVNHLDVDGDAPVFKFVEKFDDVHDAAGFFVQKMFSFSASPSR